MTEPKYTDAQIEVVAAKLDSEFLSEIIPTGKDGAQMLRSLLSERQAAMQGQGGEVRVIVDWRKSNDPRFVEVEGLDGKSVSIPWDQTYPGNGLRSMTLHTSSVQPPQPVRSVSEEDVVVIRDGKPTIEGLILAVSAYMIAVKDIFALRSDGPPYNERKVTEDTAALQAFDRLNDTGRAMRAALEHFAAIAQEKRS